MPEAGQLLSDRYRIERPLGKGGMGAVYLARMEAFDDKPVAIKELIAGEDPDAVEQFRKEASFLANLHHPNLVKVTDFFRDGERVYLVMEYIEGMTLSSVLSREGFVAVDRVVPWARQIGSVLDYLHKQEPPVLFRDLKPSNIMLTGEGEIRLIDFGIAQAKVVGDKTATFLQGVGSSGFAPLEQYDPDRGTDARSDIYSFGATLFHLLSGQVPPSAVARSSGDALPALPDYVPAPLQELVLDCLQLRPQDRPQSVDEVLGRLTEECSQTVEVHTETMRGPVTETRPMPRRRPWSLMAVLLLVVLVVGGGVWLKQRRSVTAPAVSVQIPDKLSTATRVAAFGLERWELGLSGDPLLAAVAAVPALKGEDEPDLSTFTQGIVSFLSSQGRSARTELQGWGMGGQSAFVLTSPVDLARIEAALGGGACVWWKLGHYKQDGDTYTRKGDEWVLVGAVQGDFAELRDALDNTYRLQVQSMPPGQLVGKGLDAPRELEGLSGLEGTFDVPDGVDVVLVEDVLLVWLQ